MQKDLTPQQKTYESSLTRDEVRRAIYIDFESFADQPPTLIGYSFDQHFIQVVFDRDLESAASAKGLSVQDSQVVVARLWGRAKYERRRIVAFSQFNKNLSLDKLGVDLSPVYADARLIARKWLGRLKGCHPDWKHKHPNWEIERGLKNFLDLIGYHRPRHLGIEKTTSRILAVRDQLIKRRSFDKLTAVAKAKWTKLLDHNRHDVLGMIELVTKAVDEFVPECISKIEAR